MNSLNKKYDPTLNKIFLNVCTANVRQIAENSGEHTDSVVTELMAAEGSYGYNALTQEYEDLLKAGVIDPYKVIEKAVENAVSIANAIISSRYLIVNKIEDGKSES